MKKSQKTSQKFDQSELRPYKSKFKEGYICDADYICELVFIKRASIDKSGVSQSFWNSEQFKKDYKPQAIWARRLLKDYDVTVIIKAFQNTPFCLSLSNKKLIPLLKKYQLEFDANKVLIEKEELSIEQPRQPLSKNTNMFGEL